MCDYPFEIISLTSSTSQAFAADNSIISTRNVDTLPPTEIALHAHPYYSIVYVADCDTFTTYIDGCAINYMPGNIYFSPPDTLHSPKNQFSGMFSSVSLKFYITDDSLAEKLGKLPFRTKCDKELKTLLESLISLRKSSDKETLRLIYEIASKILNIISTLSKNTIVAEDNLYDSFFMKVIKYMYTNHSRDIELEELARVAHMEKTAFAKKFKSLYKITPINYLYSIRLSRSLDLLMSHNLPITSIAQMVGFKRATAFTTAFVRTFGMTPTEYRNKVSEIESFLK